MKHILLILLASFISIITHAADQPFSISLKIDTVVWECSHDSMYIFPCADHGRNSEIVNFVLTECIEFSNGKFCSADWRPETINVKGFNFKYVVTVQNLVQTDGQSETTIYGWMKSGDKPEVGEINFSLFIDSGKLNDPARMAGVTLVTLPNDKDITFTYTPQLKISPLVN